MGFKSWGKLSVLVFAGAALVGCNNGPQKTGPGLVQKSNPTVNPGFANQQKDFPVSPANNVKTNTPDPFSPVGNQNLQRPQNGLPFTPNPVNTPNPTLPTPPSNLQPLPLNSSNNFAPINPSLGSGNGPIPLQNPANIPVPQRPSGFGTDARETQPGGIQVQPPPNYRP